MRNTISVVLLIVAALAITSGFSHNANKTTQTNAQFNVKDLPERGLTIISPSDPSYNNMLSDFLKGRSNPVIEAFQPFSIFIKNTTNKTMVGCMLKWELMQPDGRVITDKRDYIALWSLMGTAISGQNDGVIRPNTAYLFTPSYLAVNQVANSNSGNSSAVLPTEMAEYLKQRRSELDRVINITVSIDGAFFDDGSFVGPDSAGFFAKIEAMRNARYDMLQEVKQRVQQRARNDEVFKYIEEVASGPKVELGSTSSPSDYYNSFKREAAQELLRGRSASNETQEIERVMRKLQKPWPALRKN